MIKLRTIDLSFVYPTSIKALDRVDFVAEPGEFIAMLGPNGSGKTTLLKHFVGLLKPNSGKVLLDGHDIATLSLDAVRTDVGFVFQDPNDQLFAATVAEDVAYGPRNLGLDSAEITRRVLAALDIVGAKGLETRPVHGLSYGQKRRVALAGVLAMSPKVIILDEPTASLDPLGATQMMTLLRRLNEEQGVTIVVATHDIDLVPAYAGRVYLMRGGRVVASGRPPEVFSQVDLMCESGLRIPRAAHALKLFSAELGHPIVDLPLTMEELASVRYLCANSDGGATNGEKRPRFQARGFTTGVAAAAAAKAAAELLLRNTKRSYVELRSAFGSIVSVPVASAVIDDTARSALATVIKVGVSSDDVTDGAEICASVSFKDEPGITIDGGPGVGKITRPGHPVSFGEAAINPVPRQMIADAVSAILPAGIGLRVIISVPQGEEIARRTHNPEVGIVGGIAILGTSFGINGRHPSQQEFFSFEGDEMTASGKKAVLLVGHGSRANGANEAIYRTAESVKQATGLQTVEVGFMQLCSPSIDRSIEMCVAQGATRIVVIPYFLHMGVHMQQDLPEMIQELRSKYPATEVVLGKHLGFHPKLAEIVVERIQELDGEGDG